MVASQSSPSRDRHVSSMLDLEREKFGLAKSINDLESGTNALESTLSKLKEESACLDNEDPLKKDTHTSVDDSNILRLKVYRSLGIELVEDDKGNYSKAIARK